MSDHILYSLPAEHLIELGFTQSDIATANAGDDQHCADYWDAMISLIQQASNKLNQVDEDRAAVNLETVLQALRWISYLAAEALASQCNCRRKLNNFNPLYEGGYAHIRLAVELKIIRHLGSDKRCIDDQDQNSSDEDSNTD